MHWRAASRTHHSVGRGPVAAAPAVARQPHRVFQERDERLHRCRQPPAAQVHDVPVPTYREAAHVELDQTPARELQRARVSRQNSQSEARLDSVLDGPIRAELQGNVQLGAGLASSLLQRPPAAGRRLAHHEWLVGEILQAERALLRQLVTRRRHDDQLVGEKRKDGEVSVLQRRADHSEVELVVQDLLLHACACTDLERDDDAGMKLFEGAKRGGQDVDADRRARAYAKVAPLDPAKLFELEGRLVEGVQRAPRVSVENLPRFGELHPLSESVQQRHAEGFLELFDLVRDRRLTQSQLLRGKAEAAEVGYGLERAQLTQRHRAVESQRRAVLRHGAYDMRYGRPQTKEPV